MRWFGRRHSEPNEQREAPDLPAIMPRGGKPTNDDQIDSGSIPSARWESAETVVEALRYDPVRDPGQMLLGTSGGVLIGTQPKSAMRSGGEDRHILTVAGSRSGKSVSMIIPNLLDYRGSALITDPKAELANKTALRRAADLKQAVFVLDPFGKASDAVKKAGLLASFNPLSILSRPDTFVEDADLIADALVIPGGNDPHWDESAKRFLQGVILHVATFPRYGRKRNLCTVRELLSFGVEIDPRFIESGMLTRNATPWSSGPLPRGMEGLYCEMQCNPAANAVVQAAAMEMSERPDRERESILSSARRQTSFLDLPRMRDVLTEGTFARTIPDLDVLKRANEGATIYLCLPAGYMRICSRWLRLFVDLALKAMERTDDIKPVAPVLFCLDEFPVLGYMPQLEAAAGQLASFDVRLWPIVQDLTQLKALYRDRWETFIGNAAVVQFFGNSDLTTLRHMSELVGKVAVPVRTRRNVTTQAREAGDMGLSTSIQTFDLLPVHEARTLFERDDEHARQLLLYQGYAPIIAGRIRWFEHKDYKAKPREMLQEKIENKYNYYMGLDNPNGPNYGGDPYQEVGRQLVHADGTRETATMKKVFWDYFDWLLDNGAVTSVSDILLALDYERGDRPLGEALSTFLYEAADYRKELGLPNPPWLRI